MQCYIYTSQSIYQIQRPCKENLKYNLKCQLINPAKSEVRLMSKNILECINSCLRVASASQQWRNTAPIISQFQNKQNKQRRGLYLLLHKYTVSPVYTVHSRVVYTFENCLQYKTFIPTLKYEYIRDMNETCKKHN